MQERKEADERQYLLEFTNDRGEFVADQTWARDRGANAIVSTHAPDEGRQDESLAFYNKNDF